MFVIAKIPFGKTYLLELRNNGTGEYVTLLPEVGACLHQICLAFNKTLHPLLWPVKDAATLYDEGLPGALLFPFVDRIEKGKYIFEGVEYALPCNDADHQNALHGFLYTKPFQVVQLTADEEQASVSLFYEYDGALQGFPFPFTLTVRYILTDSGVSCSSRVHNKASRNMPIGMGWHPYFQITEDHSQYEVSIAAASSFVIREDYINTGEQVPFYDSYKFFTLGNFFFSAYALHQINGAAKTILRDKKKKIDIAINSIGFPFLQLYVAPGKGIAIEPLTCVGNAFNNGIGLTILSPDETMKNSFEVSVHNIVQ